MTNAMIIFTESMRLMDEGVIGGSGTFGETEDGKKVELPEAIHTYSAWQSMGFQVRKGEKAIAKFPVWKYRNGKVDEETGEEGEGRMFMKTAAFFTAAQVDRVEVLK